MTSPPPLSALRAFVEVGLTGSMKQAANRLNVTPGAISQQVKTLEASLGVTLFERMNRELRLTPVGHGLLADMSEAFAAIDHGIRKLRPQQRKRPQLVVSTTGSFAATWLVPRLGRFTSRFPGIDVQVRATSELVSIGFEPNQAQVAIRHGLGHWPGLAARRILQPRLVPVGTPELLASGPPIKRALDCLSYPLLHDLDAQDWPLWMRAITGVSTRDARLSAGPRFGDSALLVRAAVAGQGIALLRDTYVREEIAAKRLLLAFNRPTPAAFAYYVVTRPGSPSRSTSIAAFIAWLVEESKLHGAPL